MKTICRECGAELITTIDGENILVEPCRDCLINAACKATMDNCNIIANVMANITKRII